MNLPLREKLIFQYSRPGRGARAQWPAITAPAAPAVPADAGAGAALSQAISASRSCAGTPALVAITSGALVKSDTGTKSPTTS
jgi:hypothetical protein